MHPEVLTKCESFKFLEREQRVSVQHASLQRSSAFYFF